MNDHIETLRDNLGLSKALASHLYRMLMAEYVDLPRMEAYRLRRALKGFNTPVLCTYGVGYHILPEDRDFYIKQFNLRTPR
jgi:hypothetical protein